MPEKTNKAWHWYEVNRIVGEEFNKIINRKNVGVKNIGSYLTKQLLESKVFLDNHNWFAKSYKLYTEDFKDRYEGKEPQVDPLQLYLSYSMSSLKEPTRILRINAILKAIGSSYQFDDIIFDGMPAPLGIRSLSFKPLEDSTNLWEYYVKIQSNQSLKKEEIENTLSVYGVDISLLSIFSFWISPNRIIPVDQWTLEIIKGFEIPSINGSSLKKSDIFHKINFENNPQVVLDFTKVKSIVDLVGNAYWFKSKGNLSEEFDASKQKHKEHKPLPIFTPQKTNNFKLLGIKILNDNDLFPILKKGTLYKFYSGFDLKRSKVELKEDFYRNLYSEEEREGNKPPIKINISAIVGKNGSGKSSLIDLIHILSYNLSLESNFISRDYDDIPLKKIENVNYDLIFISDRIYKLNSIKLKEAFFWDEESSKWTNFKINRNFLNQFFYTVSVNYSIYSLNYHSYPFPFDWLSSLMHKNDNYQSPIVITPQRTEGNFDINIELHLAKQRFLMNLINIRQADEEQNIFTFKDVLDGKKFTHIKITGWSEKLKTIANEIKKRKPSNEDGMFPLNIRDIKRFTFKFKENKSKWLSVLERVFYQFEIDIPVKEVETEYSIYILHKLYTVSERYYSKRNYNKLFENITSPTLPFSETDFDEFIELIFNNDSHFTDKVKQAIYFLKYRKELGAYYAIDSRIDIERLNDGLNVFNMQHSEFIKSKLNREVENFNPDQYIKNLLVPPFFNYTFIVDENDKNTYESFSSGEKQLLNSISTITYHLYNVESNNYGNEGGIVYSNVNVILDEIELYFHPEYQRQYIYKLTSIISKLPLDNPPNLNIIMSTHSPFILSDIPSQNVLKLENGKPKPQDAVNSFAANIHDILKDEFFMSGGSMGEFAKEYIASIIEDLKNADKSKEEVKQRIDIIGEPLIKNSLVEMWRKQYAQPTYEELYERYLNDTI